VPNNPFHRLVERWLPWYDPELEARRDARTEAIRLRSIAIRIRIESMGVRELRAAYFRAGLRVNR